MNRRDCLKALGVAALSYPGQAFAEIRSRLGLQLFTVRELLQTDLEGTLAAIAGLGYAEVELFGFGGNAFIQDPLFGGTGREMRQILDRHGLAAPCTQISGRVEDFGPIAEAAHALGIRNLIVAMAPEFLPLTPEGPVVSGVESEDAIRSLAERLNRLGGKVKDEGLQLGYHNHHMEFALLGETRAYDLLLERTDPSLVRMELDVGWARAGGVLPEEVLAGYPGRFLSCHLKDFDPRRPVATPPPPIPDMSRMTAPGEGIVDFARVLAEMDRQGIAHGFVECDLPENPLEVARRGIHYLKNLPRSPVKQALVGDSLAAKSAEN
jgi:sugar phosphate isomerase/epimerase